jgi:hypothetical protein
MTTHVALAGLSFSSMSGRLLLLAVLLAMVGLLLLKRARDARAAEQPGEDVHHHASAEPVAPEHTEPRSLRSRFARSTPAAVDTPVAESAVAESPNNSTWDQPAPAPRPSFGDRVKASRAAFAEPSLVFSTDDPTGDLFAAPVAAAESSPPPVPAAPAVATAPPAAPAPVTPSEPVNAPAPVAAPAAVEPPPAPVEAPVPAMAGAPAMSAAATEPSGAATPQAAPEATTQQPPAPAAPRPAAPERPAGLFAPVPPGSVAAGGRAPGATVVPKL